MREKRISTGLEAIDTYHTLLQKLITVTATTTTATGATTTIIATHNDNDHKKDDEKDIDNKREKVKKMVEEKQQLKLFEEIKSLIIDEERSFRIYFRTSGALITLFKYTKISCEIINEILNEKINGKADKTNGKIKNRNDENSENYNKILEFVRSMDLIILLIDGERAAKSKMVESGLLSSVKLLLIKIQRVQEEELRLNEININNENDNNKDGKNINDKNDNKDINNDNKEGNNDDTSSYKNDDTTIRLLICTVHFIRVCCYDDTCEKSRSIVSTDRNVLPILGNIMGNVLVSLVQKRNFDRKRGSVRGREEETDKMNLEKLLADMEQYMKGEKNEKNEKEIQEKLQKEMEKIGLGNESDSKIENKVENKSTKQSPIEDGWNLDLSIKLILECSLVGKALSFLTGK